MKPFRYASICSGIEAASVAWHTLGWSPAFLSEIDPFASAVLSHRWPGVPNLGDFTEIDPTPFRGLDLLVGGTPCQDFSVAGLRAGLSGARGNLSLEFARLVDRLRPRWIVWENVPGVLSQDRGRAFGSILGALVELGYGIAYRILDAQFFGVPQRRRRVFVVGYLGDWRRSAAVLFEPESVRGDPPKGKKAGEEIAGTLGAGSPGRGWSDDLDRAGAFIPCITGRVTHTLKAEGFDASEDGTGRGQPIVPCAIGENGRGEVLLKTVAPPLTTGGGKIGQGYAAILAFSSKDHGADAGIVSPTLRAGDHAKSHANSGAPPAIAYSVALASDPIFAENLAQPLTCRNGDPGVVAYEQTARTLLSSAQAKQDTTRETYVLVGLAARRLTPRECERLQGFPDDYTLIPYRGKLCADGPRYRALGNSMAVPVMRWIGERIAKVDAL